MKYFLLSVILLFSTLVNAVEIKLGDYKNRADVNQFIERMVWQSDYTEPELIELFSSVKKQNHLFELLDKPAEKELDWHQYRHIFIKDKRIEQGVRFWRQHAELLSRVRLKTGVPEEIIIAVIEIGRASCRERV
jgi:membrane-bound lytic murein transglycosylase B